MLLAAPLEMLLQKTAGVWPVAFALEAQSPYLASLSDPQFLLALWVVMHGTLSALAAAMAPAPAVLVTSVALRMASTVASVLSGYRGCHAAHRA